MRTQLKKGSLELCVLADYRAHIFEARERGKTDEAIAAALGDPKSLARTF